MIDKKILDSILKFRDERDWEKFHNSKDLALALSIEASELLELFLWKENENFNKSKLEDELADVMMYAILLANKNNIDLNSIILSKLEKNKEKYPVERAKGRSDKYDEL
ncbi:nucleotide pyrophosphohydrolase [uncultured Chryseobacterium sp.]|uniref:nucleotide pyrophosphohydrolase n=1 Tax=uncultured Chryseobacterium sp. TaxID=259322 RepID=UPI0025DE71E8|nr:nucleotide pyrophosphohydrolase [uncultured Chryseobacterium sp.]